MRIRLAAVVVMLALAAGAVWASVSFTPPGGQKMSVGSLPLTPTKAAGKATGSVTMVCKADLTTGMITIQANGLDPKKAYTAWLVKTTAAKGQPVKMQRTGVGKAPYALKVNGKGFGDLMADVANCKETVMQTLEVMQHAGNNAKDAKGATVIFTGELKKLLQGKQKP